MDALYNYLFHFNPYTELWSAFNRDHIAEYFNGDMKHVTSSKDKDELISIIRKKER